MKRALDRIAERRAALESTPFFVRLRETTEPDAARALWFGPPATFWVMSFQDIIRTNFERASDADVAAILRQHVAEDSGHERWFLDDLRAVFGDAPQTASSLFSVENRQVRDVAFRLMAEVIRCPDDRLRLVFVEALEAGGAAFFNAIAAYLGRSGHQGRFRYFGAIHIDAESAHEMHDDAHHRDLVARILPEPLAVDANAMIDRMFTAFELLGDALLRFAPVDG